MSRGSVTNSSSSASIQFFRGTDEKAVPEIRLTRSRDGRTGQAFFSFDQPEALINPEQIGEIIGMILIDEEGELITREVKARFVNGSPNAIEAIYTWKSDADFQRFMRFAERYAQSHGLGYTQTGDKQSNE
ncbi:photosystem II reaction center protein Psb28 [Prochlorococcus sp. MIT 1341]|uniref:photosystem II reaction center protein Psb28 n=1 Tax=Prochlorococcus sp. MIT 1341 TaxID=3096221 RepID=UPI002A760AA2|nr:photosystem II reaction center protein Psb28 [Prochlorococcus sp. MIT 1341]